MSKRTQNARYAVSTLTSPVRTKGAPTGGKPPLDSAVIQKTIASGSRDIAAGVPSLNGR